MKDLESLNRLKKKLELEIQNLANLPEEVVSKMLAASKEADQRESNTLPETYGDPDAAGKIYMDMLEKNPFFKNISRSDKIALQMHIRSMDKAAVVNRLSRFAPSNSEAEMKKMELVFIIQLLEAL